MQHSCLLKTNALLFSFFILAACQVELYRSEPERDVNQMIAILQHHDIEASKQEGKDEGYYALFVEENQFARAVELLTVQGYPRRAHKNLGELFQPSGLVPTQFEEKIRYTYGLSEELSRTIGLFDGVVDNRVHISLPQQEEGGSESEEARVSVYIKYDQDIDFDNLIPQVKKLVSDSVGLVPYSNVEVLAQPNYFHKGEKDILTAYAFPAGIRVLPEYYSFFVAFCIAIFLIIIQLGAASVWFFRKWQVAEASLAPKKQLALPEKTEEAAPAPPGESQGEPNA